MSPVVRFGLSNLQGMSGNSGPFLSCGLFMSPRRKTALNGNRTLYLFIPIFFLPLPLPLPSSFPPPSSPYSLPSLPHLSLFLLFYFSSSPLLHLSPPAFPFFSPLILLLFTFSFSSYLLFSFFIHCFAGLVISQG